MELRRILVTLSVIEIFLVYIIGLGTGANYETLVRQQERWHLILRIVGLILMIE